MHVDSRASAGAFPDFFFKDTATTEIYTLSLHDALPISARAAPGTVVLQAAVDVVRLLGVERDVVELGQPRQGQRSEEHTSELQSRQYLVCRLLLEKKKKLMPSLERSSLIYEHWHRCAPL